MVPLLRYGLTTADGEDRFFSTVFFDGSHAAEKRITPTLAVLGTDFTFPPEGNSQEGTPVQESLPKTFQKLFFGIWVPLVWNPAYLLPQRVLLQFTIDKQF